LDKQKLLAAIDDGRANSYGTDEESSLGQKRAQAIEAYLGLNTDPAPEGRSQVVDRSVYETIQTLLASLIRIYSGSSDDVCKFMPVGPDDEEAADQTTAVIAHVVTQQNQWEQIVSDWIHDAFLMCNAYAMAYWDDETVTERETYEGQSDDQLAALMQAEGVEIVQHTETIDEEATQQQMQAYEQALQQMPPGMPPPPPPGPVVLHDVVIERKEEGKVCIKTIPPEHCYVHVNTPDWTLKDCPYFEVRQQKTIADLRAMGLEVPEDVSDNEDDDSEEESARNRFGEDLTDGDGKGVMREVWARMIWVRADVGDGKSRLYYVVAVGRTILFSEPCNRIPVSSMTPQPLPHRHIGMSIAEVVQDLQNIKTAVKRGALDNLYLANNGRHAISSKVNLADFLDARPGGIVRMLDDSMPAEGHIMPLVHPVMFDQVIGSLEYFDQERQNRSGVMRGAAGLEANAMNRAAVGTTMAMQSHSAMRTEHIARMLAPAVETLFSIVHELISKHRNKPLTIKIRGKWTTVDPTAWASKRDVKISVGVGAGNKEAMMQQLQGVLMAQMQIGMPLGLVTRENVHATNVEIMKLAGFSNPEKFWPDPKQLPLPQPPMPPEAIKAQADMQKEHFKAQQEAQKFQADQALERERMQYQAQLDQQREEMQARQKTLEQQLSAQLKQIELDAKERQEAAKLEFQKWQTEFQAAVQMALADKSAQAGLEQNEAAKRPDQGSQDIAAEMLDILRQMKAEADSPAEIVRDQVGRAIGVRRGDRVRPVARGPDGRVTGIQ
jgi:hypothetical protein